MSFCQEFPDLLQFHREHYSKDCCDSVQYVQRIGDFCCAKFTEDDCWYRAQVVEIAETNDLQGQCFFFVVAYYSSAAMYQEVSIITTSG